MKYLLPSPKLHRWFPTPECECVCPHVYVEPRLPLEVGGLCDSTLTEEGADKKGETVVFH